MVHGGSGTLSDVPLEGYVTVVEAARILGVTDRHVRDLIRLGRLQAEQVTRRLWLVDRGSVEEYQRTRRPPGRPRRLRP